METPDSDVPTPSVWRGVRILVWPDFSRYPTTDQERTLLPATFLGLAMTSGLIVAVFGLLAVLALWTGNAVLAGLLAFFMLPGRSRSSNGDSRGALLSKALAVDEAIRPPAHLRRL